LNRAEIKEKLEFTVLLLPQIGRLASTPLPLFKNELSSSYERVWIIITFDEGGEALSRNLTSIATVFDGFEEYDKCHHQLLGGPKKPRTC